MSKILINYPCDDHAIEDIRVKVAELLEKLEAKYSIGHECISEDQYNLNGSGITGEVNIDTNHIAIEASLGFMMMAFKGMIETEIVSKLDETFQS